jgi:chorismate synthase
MKEASDTSVVIRDIETIAEIQLVEELQKDVWGVPDIEVVPMSQLVAAIHAGGVLLGALDGDVLAGFAYGFVAKENGKIAHHSHMVGVRSEYRSLDLGFRLKAAQRERVLGQGIELMSWTFDPLQSMNAHFNFGKLGVVADLYFVDFYGSNAHSFLHQNGTDRLWVTWRLTDERVIERIEKQAVADKPANLPKLVECGLDDVPTFDESIELASHDRVAVEIPADITAIEEHDPMLAASWRQVTRSAFTRALGSGYFVEDFFRGDRAGAYVLTKKDDDV